MPRDRKIQKQLRSLRHSQGIKVTQRSQINEGDHQIITGETILPRFFTELSVDSADRILTIVVILIRRESMTPGKETIG